MSEGNTLFTTEHDDKRWRVRLEVDQDPVDPREMDNLWTFIFWHKRYTLGDKQPRDAAEHEAFLREIATGKDDRIVVPVYMLDHSGLRFSLSDFHDTWDSGVIGVASVARGKLKVEGLSEEQALERLKVEVETYDQYVSGDVYGFVVETQPLGSDPGDKWSISDSVCGFYGSEVRGNGMLEYWDKHLTEAYDKAFPVRTSKVDSGSTARARKATLGG